MAYPSPTTINGSRGIVSLLEYVNTVTNFWISRMILVGIFIIFFMGYLRSKTDDDMTGAFAVASFASFVVGLPLWLLNFIDGYSFSIVVGLLIIASAVLMFDKRGQ